VSDIKIMACSGGGMSFSTKQMAIDYYNNNKSKKQKKHITDPEKTYQNVFIRVKDNQSKK
jgi:hypothetical protein